MAKKWIVFLELNVTLEGTRKTQDLLTPKQQRRIDLLAHRLFKKFAERYESELQRELTNLFQGVDIPISVRVDDINTNPEVYDPEK